MLSYVLVAIGGALGSVLRFWCSGAVANSFGESFPWGTLIINVSGSFIIGFFATLTGDQGRLMASTSVRQFFMIGLCGGYTTFSSFSHQTLMLAQKNQWLWAGANVVMSVVLCLVGVWLGHVLAASLSLKH
jgi:CrcB protein